eukprot:GHVS01053612.1.p1 GENE.GHVS01053612.1~~GHVS01053612.1.p1  ORF type:complete len:500 (-),score=59.79 GHVS01053612.1:381-1880(-)
MTFPCPNFCRIAVYWAAAVWAHGFLSSLLGSSLLCAAQDTLGLTNTMRDFRRRYAFSGFEDAGFYQYAAADSNFFQQIRCRPVGGFCSVHVQCCSSFCTYGKCHRIQSLNNRSSIWGGRFLGENNSVGEEQQTEVAAAEQQNVDAIREFSYMHEADGTAMALGSSREQDLSDIEYPNEGDNQLRQAINAAFRELFQKEDLYESCWSPFLEKQLIRPSLQPEVSPGTCVAVRDPYPSRSDATGTFLRVFEEEVIYFGTFAEVPPFSYFVSRNERKYWGFDAEVVLKVMGFFNRRYKTEVQVKASFVPAQRGLFNNAADALYNGQVDIFFGKLELNAARCAIVGCGCPYYNTGNLALVGGIRKLHGNPPHGKTEWNDPGAIIGILADDTHIGEIAQLLPKVTLRLFWSFWDMGEHLSQGEIHAAVSDMSVASFMQTMYDIYCPDCFTARIFEPNSHVIGWAFRQFPAPQALRQVNISASVDAIAPLPRVYSIEKHSPPPTF